MIKIRDISILGLLGVVQFFVLSETFHWHYSIFIAYACFCLGYIFYKLGCDAAPFWTIGRKLLYWAPIVVAIILNITYYLVEIESPKYLLMGLDLFFLFVTLSCFVLKKMYPSFGDNEWGLYLIFWLQIDLVYQMTIGSIFNII